MRKNEILKRTDHRLDLSPEGWNLFISRDKQEQNRAARRIKIWMRIVIVLVILAGGAALFMVGAFYLVPWFRQEIMRDVEEPSSVVEAAAPPALEYDKLGLPVYGDEVCLFVVNKDKPVTEDFLPDLVEVSGVKVDAHISGAMRQMLNAAKEDGLSLTFTEGFVTYEQQEERFDGIVKGLMEKEGLTTVMAAVEAATIEPPAGACDFQSGMCLRLDGNPETFTSSRTYSWLKSNMGKYGFIFRWPEDKDSYTGVKGDWTVIRYVGGRHASAMQQRSMCLEEYIDYLDSQ